MGYLANEISQEREHWLELRPKDGSGAWDFYRWLSSRPTAAAAAKPAPDDYVLDGASADQAGSAEQERPKRGTFFDETVDIRDPEGHELAIAVLERVATSEPPRKRKRSASAQANQYALVRAILANGFRCHWHRDPGITSFFRKPDAGVYLKRDKPSWLSANAMQRALSALEGAGLTVTVTGERYTASSFRVTPLLLELALAANVTSDSLRRRVPANRLVRLYGKKPKPDFDWFDRELIKGKGEQIELVPTAETERWTAILKANNDFLAEQDIDVELSAEHEAQWVAELNADEWHTGASFCVPERIRTDVYRVFNNGSKTSPTFAEGGRMFGGWWINAPKKVRPHITINGQPTIELDYVGCHPNMLYHERGLTCDGDPYDVAEISDYAKDIGLRPETYRDGIKWLMQVLINGGNRPDLAKRTAVLPPAFTIQELIQLVEQRHQPIVGSFKTGAGLRLMRRESDIALDVVTTARTEGWVALPIHDSFVATGDRKATLMTLMVECYEKEFGIKPTINEN